MLAPLAPNQRRKATAKVVSVPPPINGWNATSDLSAMKPTDAVVLDNYIPGETGVFTRDGYIEHATGLGSAVLALMEYSGPDTTKLFAATSSAIYNVTSAGAVGAAELSGFANGNWQSAMFATSGGNFMVCANGADAVRVYNGTAWSTPAITGVSSANLITVTVHMARLWFCQTNTLKVWYLPVSSIAGAAGSLDLGSLCRLGGQIWAMGSWSRDSGAGPEDHAVFVTSRGEVIVYSGTDPSSADTWSIVGVYKVPEPVGRRCLVKIGGDLAILTTQGLLSLSTVLPMAASGQAKQAATERIGGAFALASAAGASLSGWQVVEYAKGQLVIVNVPIAEATTQHQYVLNSYTGKWCRFTGMNAACWGTSGTRLFWGGNSGTVYEYTGDTDDGEVIDGVIVTAFQDFGTPRTKQFKRIKPQFFGPAGYQGRVGLRVDYDDSEVTIRANSYEQTGSAWDESDWDVAGWADDSSSQTWWESVTGEGFVGAIVVTTSSALPITYNGAKILFELGDQL